ncbi:MAG: 30S ribosomal protein S16 [Patescibacteria group bacterium]
MSVSIKLSRYGAKNSPYYRIVAAPTRSKRDGKNLAIIGNYDPKLKKLKVNKELFDEWIKKGAIITSGVRKIIK